MIFETTEYKGKNILLIPFSNCKNNVELLQMLEALGEFMRKSDGGLLTLIDATGVSITSEFMAKAKVLSRDVFQHKREKGAVLGITGVKVLLLKTYNLFSKDKLVPFSNREDALEYLVK